MRTGVPVVGADAALRVPRETIGPILLAAPLPPGLSPWAFHPHPEVYLEVLALAAAYWAALRLLGPRFVEPGEPAATRGQKLCFAGGLLFIALAEGWPLSDIANNYLYSAHMVQHLLFTLAAPPLFLLGTPHWLARTLVRRPGVWPLMKRLTRPLPAAIMMSIGSWYACTRSPYDS